MKQAFMDTSGLVGFLIKGDGLNHVATQVLHDLSSERYFFYTNQWVEYEVLSALRSYGIRFCQAYAALKSRINLHVEPVTQSLEQEAVDIFWSYEDKSWGIIDCVTICQLWGRHTSTVFGCDLHFQQAGLFPLIRYDDSGTPVKTYSFV